MPKFDINDSHKLVALDFTTVENIVPNFRFYKYGTRLSLIWKSSSFDKLVPSTITAFDDISQY